MSIVSVQASVLQDGLYTKVISEDKTFFADEPLSLGGSDLAPNPVQYFLGSLATCMCITLRMYAQRKGWVTGRIMVNVSLQSGLPEGNVITKSISFENELSHEQKERLWMIAEKCPVSKLIREGVMFRNEE